MVPEPVAPVAASGVAEAVLAVVEARTGYERELLELDLDLEADLGIDTIKQAQILAELAEQFGLALDQDELALGELPTLQHVIDQLELRVEPAPEPVAPAAASGVAEAVLAVVEARTGYERELLELDLDLEADLGIDTIKQAQILAELAEQFGLALDQDELALGELPTLQHVIDQLELRVEPTPEPVAPAAASGVAEAVLAVVEARTGYERELLELDLDLEADLGIDTIKQAQILAELAEQFGLALDQDELALGELPTLQHVIDQLELRIEPTPEPVAPAAASACRRGGARRRRGTHRLRTRAARARPRPRSRPRHRHDQTSTDPRRARRTVRARTRPGRARTRRAPNAAARHRPARAPRHRTGSPGSPPPTPEPTSAPGRIVRYAVVSAPAPLELEPPGLAIGEGWNVLVVGGDAIEAASVCDAFAGRGARAVPVSLPAAPGDREPDRDTRVPRRGGRGRARKRAMHSARCTASSSSAAAPARSIRHRSRRRSFAPSCAAASRRRSRCCRACMTTSNWPPARDMRSSWRRAPAAARLRPRSPACSRASAASSPGS